MEGFHGLSLNQLEKDKRKPAASLSTARSQRILLETVQISSLFIAAIQRGPILRPLKSGWWLQNSYCKCTGVSVKAEGAGTSKTLVT